MSRVFIVMISGSFLLSACKTDFDVNTTGEETYVVYGLLEANKTVQYIRIQKAYTNTNADALTLANLTDSIYPKDSVQVKLIERVGGNILKTFILQRDFSVAKDTGLFASTGAYLYRTAKNDSIIRVDAQYELEVTSVKLKSPVRAFTSIVDFSQSLYPLVRTTSIALENTVTNVPGFGYLTARNSRFYDYIMTINYNEYNKSDNTLIATRQIKKFLAQNNLTRDLNGANEVRPSFRGFEFFNLLRDNVQVNANVYRRITLIDFTTAGGGDELYNYIQVNTGSTGVSQKRPEYTNVIGGFGIFSSRNISTISKPLRDETVEDIINDPVTRDFNFRM